MPKMLHTKTETTCNAVGLLPRVTEMRVLYKTNLPFLINLNNWATWQHLM